MWIPDHLWASMHGEGVSLWVAYFLISVFITISADKENEGLVEFFKARNPTTDLSLNVDSLLTKPIVVSDPTCS